MNKTEAQLFIIFTFLLYHMSSADEKEEDAIVHYLNNNSFVQGKAEIVFLLDRSGSIGAANFEEEKGFVESFLTHIVVDVNATRVAVISFSDNAERHIDFLREPKSKCFLSQELQDVVFKNSGATNTAAAIQEAALVFENARPNVNKVIIFITDGFSNKGGDPVPHAAKLKQKGVQIFAFGIGRFLKTELQSLASSPNHAFSSSDFKEFKRLARKIRGDPHEVSWSGQASQPNCDHLCESPYKGDPNDPGCCDHDARCSCALLSGMHTCVCGPGYYGLSGLMGQCRACPRGTYKSKLEPTRSCTLCPPGATTAELASTSVNDCYCKDGYFGDPSSGVPCTLVKCPPLQKPTNGFIVGSCESTYGSTCFFMCEDGYELVDQRDDTRTCESNGKWTRNTAVCRKVICPVLQKPRFGNKVCDSGMLTVGKRCRFNCWEGYIMQGSEERECLPNKKWSGSEVKCLPVECPLPPPIRDGWLFGCTSVQKPVYGQTCMFRCNYGFELRGPEYLRCNENGKLLDKYHKETKPQCKDVLKPEILCPKPIRIYSEKGKNGANVKWYIPVPNDNSGFAPKMYTVPTNINPPAFISIGTTVIQYVAVDSSGLNATCHVQIEVIDNEPPTVLRCPSKVEVSTSDTGAKVFWEEPVFVDNSKSSLYIYQTDRPGDRFAIGRHTVSYSASDKAKNTALCTFDVIVTRTPCAYYPAPANGAFTCNDWLTGQFCQAYCNDRFDFVFKPAEWYVCDSESQWITLPSNMPIPWPDCARPAMPGKVRQMVTGFYYSGDCNDPRVQNFIKKLFLGHFTTKIQGAELCFSRGTCSFETVQVRCGRSDPNLVLRKRRDVWEYAEKEELEIEFEITINVDHELNDTEAVLQDFLETIRNIKWDFEEDAVLETTTYAPFIEPLSIHKNINETKIIELTNAEIDILCKPGSVLTDDLCVQCPPGTFYDNSIKECLDCPLGEYQENEGQLQCEKCPSGKSTEHRRTRNETDCKDICLAGTYSPTGLETCMACPRGTYQEHSGQYMCDSCPNGATTINFGSTSLTDCKVSCEPGFFSESGLYPCHFCPKGFYQPSFGQMECLECPSNLSTIYEGAKEISDCLDLDPCLNETFCFNGGSCVRSGREGYCDCERGFEGERCESDINECNQNPCYNNGRCINTEGHFFCNCTDGFSGDFCNIEIDECESSPCLNNGTCIDKVNGYLCVCPTGFFGSSCEIEQEICFRNIPCLNGGVCIIQQYGNESYCECQAGFMGIDCSININDCENVVCQNNGSCIDGVASYECMCSTGYTGMLCETEINECENSLCYSGSTCEDHVGFYTCICPPGWGGNFCENKLDSDFVLTFPDSKATIANMASTTLSSPLAEATVSMWVQTTDTERSGTPLSYAVASVNAFDGDGNIVDNALTVTDCNGVEIYVNNQPLVTDLQMTDGQWHHLAFSWSSENSGMWTLYKDGELKAQGSDLRPNDVIAGGGTIVIGQEQDIIGGGFSPRETFTGNITRVNIWNNYFSKSNISRLCNMDDDIPGKVVAWPDFLQGVRGDVKVLKNINPILRINNLSQNVQAIL